MQVTRIPQINSQTVYYCMQYYMHQYKHLHSALTHHTNKMASNKINNINEAAEIKQYKVIVIGSSGVGKTALTFRLCDGRYRENFGITIGTDIRVKNVIVDNERIKLNIWDTAGLEKNRKGLSDHYYRNVDAIIIVYDLTKKRTFDEVKLWLEEVSLYCPDEVIKVLIGNKCDENAVINRQIAQQFADSHGMPLFETSAKLESEKENIEAIFLTIAHKLKANSSMIVNRDTITLQNTDYVNNSGSSCPC